MDFTHERSPFYFFWPLVLENLIDKNSNEKFPLVCKEWRQIFESNERARFVRFLINPKRRNDLLFLVLGTLLGERRLLFYMFLEGKKICTIAKSRRPDSFVTFSYGTIIWKTSTGPTRVMNYRVGDAEDFASLFQIVLDAPDLRIPITSDITLQGYDSAVYKVLDDLQLIRPNSDSYTFHKLQSPWNILRDLRGTQKKSYTEKLQKQLSKINENGLLW